jgi:hypothetical protein
MWVLNQAAISVVTKTDGGPFLLNRDGLLPAQMKTQ